MDSAAEAVIEFRDVSYRLPSGREVLRNLNLEVHRGEILVLLGRSGSGKTTALKLVNRLLELLWSLGCLHDCRWAEGLREF